MSMMMDKHELVSIIIPVYGVEKYLRQCMDSVCLQSYTNLEIIAIDDESPDKCGKILDEYAENDIRVRVLHIKNRGAAGARNAGLDVCHGQYIVFVDSDDWVEPDMVQLLLDELKRTRTDMVQCQYFDEYINRSELHRCGVQSGIITAEQFVGEMISHWEFVLLWNKMFRRKVIENLRILEGHCIDDEFFTYRTLINSSDVAIIEYPLYHYRIRKSSAMGNPTKRKQRLSDQISYVTERYEVIKTHFPNLKSRLLAHRTDVLMTVIRRAYDYPDITKEAKRRLCQYLIPLMADKKITMSMKKSAVAYLFKNMTRVEEMNCCESDSTEAYFD